MGFEYSNVCGNLRSNAAEMLVFTLAVVYPILLPPSTIAQSPPPNYSHSDMPDTNFTCADKATGGYYADPEAGCQMFHVCVRVSEEEVSDFRFLCPNDTVFDQETFICTNWYEINCERSTRYYNKNDLFKVSGQPEDSEYEYEDSDPQGQVYYEYVFEYVDPADGSTTSVYDYEDSFHTPHRLSSPKKSAGRSIVRPIDSAVSSSASISSTSKSIHKSTSVSSKKQHYTLSPFNTITHKPVAFSTGPSTTATSTTTTTTTTSTTPRPKFQNFFATHRPVISSSTPRTIYTTTYTPKITTHRPPFDPLLNLGLSAVSPNRGLSQFSQPVSSSLSSTVRREKSLSVSDEGSGRPKNLLSLEDPFAHYDWKKDSSSVTANTKKTRYETLFGSSRRGSRSSIQPLQDRGASSFASSSSSFSVSSSAISTTSTTTTIRPFTTQRSTLRRYPYSRRNYNPIERRKSFDSSVDEQLHEFSNFRFYKTAFGKSYSSDGLITESSFSSSSPSSANEEPLNFPTTRKPDRSAISASRSTRYSIFGR